MAVLLFWTGCAAPFRKELARSGDSNAAFHNAILDFAATSRLYNEDTVFLVSIEQSGSSSLRVSILGEPPKLLVTAKVTVGSRTHMPSRYTEQEGKLFFWRDADYPLTAEALAVYQKYGLLQDDRGGLLTVPDLWIDDAKKGVHYYFCPDDLSRYRKVTTRIAMGWYTPPKLRCR